MPNRLRIKKNKTKTSMDLYYSWDGLDTFIFNKHEIGRILLVNTRKSKFEKRLKGFFLSFDISRWKRDASLTESALKTTASTISLSKYSDFLLDKNVKKLLVSQITL